MWNLYPEGMHEFHLEQNLRYHVKLKKEFVLFWSDDQIPELLRQFCLLLCQDLLMACSLMYLKGLIVSIRYLGQLARNYSSASFICAIVKHSASQRHSLFVLFGWHEWIIQFCSASFKCSMLTRSEVLKWFTIGMFELYLECYSCSLMVSWSFCY